MQIIAVGSARPLPIPSVRPAVLLAVVSLLAARWPPTAPPSSFHRRFGLFSLPRKLLRDLSFHSASIWVDLPARRGYACRFRSVNFGSIQAAAPPTSFHRRFDPFSRSPALAENCGATYGSFQPRFESTFRLISASWRQASARELGQPSAARLAYLLLSTAPPQDHPAGFGRTPIP